MNSEDVEQRLNYLKNNQPKLSVYTSMDGSLYSKPEEVRALFQWLKEIHELKDIKKNIKKE